MATAKNYSIDISTTAGLTALKAYAKALEKEDPKKSADAYDLLDDMQHERAKAERRAKLTKPSNLQQLPSMTTGKMAAAGDREPGDAEEDTLELTRDAPTGATAHS